MLGIKRKRNNNNQFEDNSDSMPENIEGINNISLEDLKIKENEEKNVINLRVVLLNKNLKFIILVIIIIKEKNIIKIIILNI